MDNLIKTIIKYKFNKIHKTIKKDEISTNKLYDIILKHKTRTNKPIINNTLSDKLL